MVVVVVVAVDFDFDVAAVVGKTHDRSFVDFLVVVNIAASPKDSIHPDYYYFLVVVVVSVGILGSVVVHFGRFWTAGREKRAKPIPLGRGEFLGPRPSTDCDRREDDRVVCPTMVPAMRCRLDIVDFADSDCCCCYFLLLLRQRNFQ